MKKNPENPYVLNPYFWGNDSSKLPLLPFFERPIPHFVQFHSTTALGAFFSLLLTYLVLFKTPKNFKPYSKMLLLSCITDVIFLVNEFWCQPRPKVNDGTIMFVLQGPAKHFSYKVQSISTMLLVGIYVLSITVLPAQYYFRYVLVSTQRALSARKTLGLFMISLGTALFDSLVSYPTFAWSGSVRPNFDYCRIWTAETPCSQIIVGDIRYLPMKLYFFYAGAMIQTSYGLAMFFGYKTMKTMDELMKTTKVNAKTQNMQKQFNRILLIQTVIPLFTAVFPLSLAVFATFTYINLGHGLAYMNVIFPLLPVLNSCSTILFVSPYRRFLICLVPGVPKRFRSSLVSHTGASGGQSQQKVLSQNYISA